MSRWERCLKAAQGCVGRSVVVLAPGAEGAFCGASVAGPAAMMTLRTMVLNSLLVMGR